MSERANGAERFHVVPCPNCDGRGELRPEDTIPPLEEVETCPECQGSGRISRPTS